MTYYLGVDGGATKTKIALVDGTGRLVAGGLSGGSNYQTVGVDGAARHLAEALKAVLADGRRPSALCLGLAGLDSEGDYDPVARFVGQALRSLGLTIPWTAVNDVVVAWAAHFRGNPGAVIVSGSGAVSLAVGDDGQSAHGDGWGHWIGDEGSGFWIGRAGLVAVARQIDGRGDATQLHSAFSSFSESEPAAWFSALYTHPHPHGLITSFAPYVVDCAEQGDRIAGEILAKAGRALAVTVSATLRRVGLGEGAEVAMAGSLLRHSDLLRTHFETELVSRIPDSSTALLEAGPEMGAAFLARKPTLIPPGLPKVEDSFNI